MHRATSSFRSMAGRRYMSHAALTLLAPRRPIESATTIVPLPTHVIPREYGPSNSSTHHSQRTIETLPRVTSFWHRAAVSLIATEPLDVVPAADTSPNAVAASSSSHLTTAGCPTTLPRYLQPGFQPLSVAHPAFGLEHNSAVGRQPRRVPLSTVHRAFGTKPAPLAQHLFRGPIGVSGFFLAIDPNFSISPLRPRNRMNPNAQLTIRDRDGNTSRIRYRCQLEVVGGLHVEALVRFQVGWISPRVTFAEVPNVIHLGRGFDVSVPFLFHFTMVDVLDERGCSTGSSLYFSGTPMLGLSAGYSRIQGGKLMLDPGRTLNPQHETTHHFICHVHYRQIGFIAFKVLMWAVFTIACIPPVRRWLIAVTPNPLSRYSEERKA